MIQTAQTVDKSMNLQLVEQKAGLVQVGRAAVRIQVAIKRTIILLESKARWYVVDFGFGVCISPLRAAWPIFFANLQAHQPKCQR